MTEVYSVPKPQARVLQDDTSYLAVVSCLDSLNEQGNPISVVASRQHHLDYIIRRQRIRPLAPTPLYLRFTSRIRRRYGRRCPVQIPVAGMLGAPPSVHWPGIDCNTSDLRKTGW